MKELAPAVTRRTERLAPAVTRRTKGLAPAATRPVTCFMERLHQLLDLESTDKNVSYK